MRGVSLGFALVSCLFLGTAAFSQQSTARPPTPAQAPASPATQKPNRLTPGSIVYIVPNHGYETAISAAIARKKVPVAISEKESTAGFKIECVTDFKKGSTWRAVFLGAYNSGAETDASFRVVDVTTGIVIYAYNVHKFGSHNVQSTSEAFAKHLKSFIERGGQAE